MTDMSGLRDAAAAWAIVGGLIVCGPCAGLAAAQPGGAGHHGENHDHGLGRSAYGRPEGKPGGTGNQFGGTGNQFGTQPPSSTVQADTNTNRPGPRLPSLASLPGSPLVTLRPPPAAEDHAAQRAGTRLEQSVPLGGGVRLRGGVDVGDGVRIGGGVRVGPDTAALQSALQSVSPNIAGPEVATAAPAAKPRAGAGTLVIPNPASSLPPHLGENRLAPVPGGPPAAGPAPPIRAAPPVPVTATPPVVVPALPPPVVVPPPVSGPPAHLPSALPNPPGMSPAPVVQTPPPPPNAPLTSMAPESPPGRLPYRAGYSDYLQRASTSEVATVAVPGVTGIFMAMTCGVFVGYRRAKVGHLIRTAGITRFIR